MFVFNQTEETTEYEKNSIVFICDCNPVFKLF